MRAISLCSLVLACSLPAQSPPPPPAPQDLPERTFRETVVNVIAPTTVTTADGDYVGGLQPHDFRLYDNKTLQDIKVDVSYVPMSMVICIQRNASMEQVLPRVQQSASLFQPLVVGDRGEVAVISFDHRVERLLEFTSDGDKLQEAFKKLKPGSQSSRMIDAVSDAIRMLRTRPVGRRRIVVLISETRDGSSESKLRDVVTDAQFANVIVYPIDVSRLLTTLTKKAPAPRPDPFPPASRPLPPGAPRTPQTVQTMQGYGSLIPAFVELFKSGVSIFKDNPAEVFSKFTGGREFSFMSQRQLDDAISHLGEELHSQYLITYSPSNKSEGGFHEIEVRIAGRPELKVRTRTGYWIAGGGQ